MKTINDAAIECANKYVEGYRNFYPANEGDFIDVFESGVEFAQQFINIEDEKPEYHEPVIIELQNGGVIAWRGWSEIYGDTYTINGTDIYLMAKEVKLWRPINFK